MVVKHDPSKQNKKHDLKNKKKYFTLETFQWNFPLFRILKNQNGVIKNIERKNTLTRNHKSLHKICLKRGLSNILSRFDLFDFCNVAIGFAKIEFVKNLDPTMKL